MSLTSPQTERQASSALADDPEGYRRLPKMIIAISRGKRFAFQIIPGLICVILVLGSPQFQPSYINGRFG